MDDDKYVADGCKCPRCCERRAVQRNKVIFFIALPTLLLLTIWLAYEIATAN